MLIILKTSIEKPITAPIEKGKEYGQLLIKIEGKPEIEIPLVAEKNISAVNPFFKIFAAGKYLLFGSSLNE